MKLLRMAARLAYKDLQIEIRTGEIVISTTLFGVLVTILGSLSFYLDPVMSIQVAPGVLWITITFSGLLAMSRSWARERDNDVIRALLLAPIPRAAIFLGKALGVLAFLTLVELVLVPLTGLFFHIDFGAKWKMLLAILALGSVGFVAAGTLFTALSVRTRARDLTLSVVVFPLVTPALLAAVVATRELLGNAPWSEIDAWLRILGAFALVFVAGGIALFDLLMRE